MNAPMIAGYVYVLVNSSMPGLVKVGRTTRSVSERVSELSSPTGVATPFIVIFEQPFTDCGAAEAAVHAELEHKGFRAAQNREFFRATPNEVIRIILSVAGRSEQAMVDEFADNEEVATHPWDDVLAEANTLLSDEEDSLQDVEEALKLFKTAARMGSAEACRILGSLYAMGLEVQQDYQTALVMRI